MPPKRKPLGELSHNTIPATIRNKRTKSSRAAAARANAAVSELVSATADWHWAPSGPESAPEFFPSPTPSERNTLAALPVAAENAESEEVPFEPLERGEHNMHAQLPAGYRVNEVSES
jgi:hypothetical protein